MEDAELGGSFRVRAPRRVGSYVVGRGICPSCTGDTGSRRRWQPGSSGRCWPSHAELEILVRIQAAQARE